MNIYFHTKNIEVSQYEKNFMANRLYGLNKFFSYDANAYVDIDRAHQSHNGYDLYHVSIKIDDPSHQYFAEEYRENVKTAFDHAYGDVFRLIRKHRGRKGNIARRARRRLKKLFKRQK